MKKVSVVMPVYNGQEYLNEAIESVLQSSYKNLELIIVNDGSTDGSKLIIDKYKNDNRVHIINQSNMGIVSSRNKGLEHATGDYLSFIDQDDIVDKEFYSKCIKKIEIDNSSMCVANYYEWYKERKVFRQPVINENVSNDTDDLCGYLIGGGQLST